MPVGRFVLVWALNSFLIYLANLLYPSYFVLGTARVSPFWAVLVSGFLLTLFCKLSKPFLARVGFTQFTGRGRMFVFYWLVNSVGLWFIARMAPITGFGIAAFYWAFVLGLVVNLAQWLSRQFLKSVKFV